MGAIAYQAMSPDMLLSSNERTLSFNLEAKPSQVITGNDAEHCDVTPESTFKYHELRKLHPQHEFAAVRLRGYGLAV